MEHVSFLATGLAALAGFMVGSLWYGPLFGKAWQRETGLTQEDLRGANMPLIFGLTFLINVFAALVLGYLLKVTGFAGLGSGALAGGCLGLGFVVPALAVNYLFARKPLALFLIDAGYWVLIYAVMGAVIGGIG